MCAVGQVSVYINDNKIHQYNGIDDWDAKVSYLPFS